MQSHGIPLICCLGPSRGLSSNQTLPRSHTGGVQTQMQTADSVQTADGQLLASGGDDNKVRPMMFSEYEACMYMYVYFRSSRPMQMFLHKDACLSIRQISK